LSEAGEAHVYELKKQYESLGYGCFFVSATDANDVRELAANMQGKVNLISGHSGVGKSTLINALEPALDLRIGEISQAHSKGMHTTTFAEMFPLKNGGWVIDTPGIKEFGLIDLDKNELSHFFPEMRERFGQCKFHNCQHDHEPGCAIIAAVEIGEIEVSRYTCYLAVLHGEELDKEYD
jgi:ribosome biogenesis GTPase / thiamine phosphate phosphatase